MAEPLRYTEIWNQPHNFVGREEIINPIVNWAQEHGPSTIMHTTVIGAPKCGKTALLEEIRNQINPDDACAFYFDFEEFHPDQFIYQSWLEECIINQGSTMDGTFYGTKSSRGVAGNPPNVVLLDNIDSPTIRGVDQLSIYAPFLEFDKPIHIVATSKREKNVPHFELRRKAVDVYIEPLTDKEMTAMWDGRFDGNTLELIRGNPGLAVRLAEHFRSDATLNDAIPYAFYLARTDLVDEMMRRMTKPQFNVLHGLSILSDDFPIRAEVVEAVTHQVAPKVGEHLDNSGANNILKFIRDFDWRLRWDYTRKNYKVDTYLKNLMAGNTSIAGQVSDALSNYRTTFTPATLEVLGEIYSKEIALLDGLRN